MSRVFKNFFAPIFSAAHKITTESGQGDDGLAETLWGCTLLALALSMDTFAAGLALGTQQIKIPFCSALALGLTCSFSLWAAVSTCLLPT